MLPFPAEVDADVAGDGEKPGAERRPAPLVESRQAMEGLEEHILSQVLDLFAAPVRPMRL